MNQSKNVLNTRLIKAQTIKTNSLQVKQLQIGKKRRLKKGTGLIKVKHELSEKIHSLAQSVRKLKKQLRNDFHELQEEILSVQGAIIPLEQQIAAIQQELISGLIPNPALQSFFTSKVDQTVTVTTASGTITGQVIDVGTDAVELLESNGDIVVIPYSKITSAS